MELFWRMYPGLRLPHAQLIELRHYTVSEEVAVAEVDPRPTSVAADHLVSFLGFIAGHSCRPGPFWRVCPPAMACHPDVHMTIVGSNCTGIVFGPTSPCEGCNASI